MKRVLPFFLLIVIGFFCTTSSYSQFWEEEETSSEKTEETEEGAFGIWGEEPQDTTKSESSFWDAFKGEPEDSATAARKRMIENADTDKKKNQFNAFGKDDFRSKQNNTKIQDYEGSTVMLTGKIADENGKPIQENIYLVNEFGKRKLCRANKEGIYKAIIPSGGYYNIYLRNRIVDKPIVVVQKTSAYKELSHDFNVAKIKEGSLVFAGDIFGQNKSDIVTPLDTLKTMLNSYENVSFTIEVNAPVAKQKNKKTKLDEKLAQARVKELESTLKSMGIHKRLYEIKHSTKPKSDSENKIVIRIKETTKLQ